MGRRIVTFSLAWLLASAIAPAAHGDNPVQSPPPGSSGSPYNFATGQTAAVPPPAVVTPARLVAPSNSVQPAQGSLEPPPITATPPLQPIPIIAPAPAPTLTSPTILPVQNVNPAAPPATRPPSGNAPPIEPTPGQPGGPPIIEPPVFESPTIPLPAVSTRKLKITNRSSNPTNARYFTVPSGEQIAVLTGGIQILATFPERNNLVLDIEADQVVVWKKGGQASELVDAMQRDDGVTQGNESEIELYLSGNVIMRYGQNPGQPVPRPGKPPLTEDKVMRAERVYYDVTHNKALALNADLELIRSDLPEPAHFKSKQLIQVSPEEFKAVRSTASASKLPGDPGLDIYLRDVVITEERNIVTRSIFGFPVIDRTTGQEDVGTYRYFTARNSLVQIEDVPIMWFPYLAGDVNDPTGPLQSFVFREDRIFGAQFYSTWSILELAGIKKLPGERLDLSLDYLTSRGPGAGLTYDLAAQKLFGFEAPFTTHAVVYGIHDMGEDQLGGTRDLNWDPPGDRGRAYWRHIQDYEDFSFQGQVAYLSDPNFLEQYYKYEFDQGPNQETFAYLKYQSGIGAATLLAEPNLARPWVTETQWLPKLDGWWLGQSLFDRLTYNTWASVGYGSLQVYNLPPDQLPPGLNPAVVPREVPVNSGRFDWMQQLSAPFSAGAFKIVPYGNVDLAYYTEDNAGDSRGRFYAGGGARVSMPLSRLYNDVSSEFFNLQGLYHKIEFGVNYYNAYSNMPFYLTPQLDRLNDDATQQSVRDINPWEPVFYPGPTGNALFHSPLYDPRLYALRRLNVDGSTDELGTIQEVQAEINQRWQTKRGYPGMEHTVDYFTLDLSATFYPAPNRDDFGHPVSFVEYNSTWAVGDRNGFTSNGWFDPFAFGTKYFNVNAYLNRPDGTNFVLGYRNFEPVGSHVVYASLGYQFSPKYSVSFNTSYDFGIANNESIGFMLNRIGTDLTWTIGFTYNAILNNFGFTFMVIPNLAAARGIGPGALPGFGH